MIGMPFYSPDELGAVDLLAAVLAVTLVLVCASRARRRENQRPISRHALTAITTRLDEQERHQ